MALTRSIPVRVRSLSRIRARLSVIRSSNGHGSGPLDMPLSTPLSTVRRAQPLSPNTLLRWDDDIPVPLTIDFMNIRAATAACVFCLLVCKPCFFAAISVRIAPALCVLQPHGWCPERIGIGDFRSWLSWYRWPLRTTILISRHPLDW